MPFVKKAILDKLLRDDEEWKKLLVEGQAEAAKQVGDQYRAQIEDQEKVIASLLDDNARLGNSRDERLRLSALDLATRHGQDVMGDARRFEAFLRDGGQEDRAVSAVVPALSDESDWEGLWWQASQSESEQECQIRGCSRRAEFVLDAGGLGLLRMCSTHSPAPAPSETAALDELLRSIIWDPKYGDDKDWVFANLAAALRSSPVLPPEDVARRVGTALYGINYDEAHAAPDLWRHLVEEQDRKIAAVLGALRAPVPVETVTETEDEADQGKAILDELHERGIVPNTLITPSGVTFVVGQRIGWTLKDTLKQTGGIGTITEFDPRRGLTDGLTVKVERDGKDPVWVNPEWISVWEDPE